ncbi:MAG: cbb3-type cytochrome c oxidase subunit I [Bacteroidota bacterium]
MQVIRNDGGLTAGARAELRGWLLLALGALAVAGVLALALAASRTPGVQQHVPWGAEFFQRGLVTHVVFSFQVWLLAMMGALSAAATSAAGRPLGWVGLALTVAGGVLLLVPVLGGTGTPSLNNYVPVLDHPLFFAGLMAVALGVAVALSRCLVGGDVGMAAVALCVLAALACFVLAAVLIPADTPAGQRNEALFWGGGHVLQFANTAVAMAGWQSLTRSLWGRDALPPRMAAAAYALLVLGAMLGPALYVFDVLGPDHREAFTTLFQLVLPAPALAMGAGLAWRLWRGPRPWRSPAFLALALSLAVFALGGVAGYALGQGDTRTPSHYHAMIGGVNLVLIGLIHARLLPRLGRGAGAEGWVRAQIWLYGGGQALHALGFWLAGLAGVARKTAGAEQGLDSAVKLAAMGLAGAGAAIAVIGGVIFVAQVLGGLLQRGIDAR